MVRTWGMTAETASEGNEALEKLSQFNPDVILTDINMPGLDGFGFLQRMREMGDMPPTIVLTAYGNVETAVRTVQDLGAYWYLEKPIQANSLEVLLRRQAKSGIFGWVSYTLSKAERYRDGAWAPYDFDRTHLFNLVMGLPLRRNWDIGVRMQYQSGLPATTTAGYNTARADGYVRFDVRVDKRAVYRSWLLDFYVDITNVALLPEEVTPGNTIRYVLPTVGFRGRF